MPALLGGLILLGAAVRSSGAEGIGKDVYEDDFGGGLLLDWEHAPGAVVETAELEGNSALYIRCAGEAVLTARKFGCFVLGIRVQGTGGIRFGGRHTVALTPTTLEIIEKSGQSASVPLKICLDDKRIFRDFSVRKTHGLKIVFAPSFLRVYLDGRKEFEKTVSLPAAAAPIALIAEGDGAFFDDLRISPIFSAEEGTRAIPIVKDDALIFDCGKEIVLELQTANHTRRELDLSVSVCPFDSVRLAHYTNAPKNSTIAKFGTDRFCAIEPMVDKRVASAATKVKPGEKLQAIQVALGKVPAGFYMLDLTFADGTNKLDSAVYPFAATSGAASEEHTPLIYVGAYLAKMPMHMKESQPLWWNTYLRATADKLKQHNMNVVVAQGDFDPATMETFQKYGIATLTRGLACLDHPAVIGTLLGDEPKQDQLDYYRAQYEAAHKATQKPALTCCIGGHIGIGGKYWFWDAINPKIRLFRWYMVKKHFYGIQHHVVYQGALPLSAELRCVSEMSATPCWFVLPALGGTEHEAYYQYPSAEETRGIMHMVLAYGVKGILCYTFQDAHGMGLVNAETLAPNGGNLAAVGEIAALARKHAKLLCSLKVGKLDVRCESPDIEPVPLHDGQDGRYVYAINRNTKERFAGRLFWPNELKRTRVEDIFAGREIETQSDNFYTGADLDLEPGGGALLAVMKEP